MPYEKTNWRNNQPPAINETNLNHGEEGIQQCSLDTITGGTATGSGNNLVITLTTNDPEHSHTISFNAVAWLSQSAFYPQAYIDSCFTEVDLPNG